MTEPRESWSSDRGHPAGETQPRQYCSEERREWAPNTCLAPLPPLIFCQDLPLAKSSWKPDGKGAQVRQSPGDILPGGEAEDGGKMGLLSSIYLLCL